MKLKTNPSELEIEKRNKLLRVFELLAKRIPYQPNSNTDETETLHQRALRINNQTTKPKPRKIIYSKPK